MNHTSLLNFLIEKYAFSSYLEIGVDNPHLNFDRIRCIHKVGVDPAARRSDILMATSDFYFLDCQEKFDLIFIDGLHHYEQVLRDIHNALYFLNPDGIIVCHDMLPQNESMQAVPRNTILWTGDCWKAWLILRMTRDDLSMHVVDSDFGIGLITRGKQELYKKETFFAEPDFSYFLANKQEMMNVIDVPTFNNMFSYKVGIADGYLNRL